MTKTEEYVNTVQECLREKKFGPLRMLMEQVILSLRDTPSVGSYYASVKLAQPYVSYRGDDWEVSVGIEDVHLRCCHYGGRSGATYREAAASLTEDLNLSLAELKSVKRKICDSLTVPDKEGPTNG